ncbi:MAG: hypothetical protein IIZ27_09030 [Solobacterium sp.]|nr:hypothetical protein [Solobacterium sp.]
MKTLKKNTESETYPEGKENEKTIVSGIPTEKGKDISLYNVLLIMLLLFSLLGNVFQWMLSTGYIQINPGDTTERNTGMAVYNEVIENTVTIPLDESEMEEGETKIKIYGVTVKEENGKIKSSAMSLGEYRIAE